MYRLFFTPEWFNGWDIAFDVVGLVVALLIAVYSWRIYSINKENRFIYFSLAFLLVALSFLAKSFTNGVLYFFPVREAVAEVLRPVAGAGLSLSDLYYRAGFFLQMVSMLGAWLLIFFISQKSRARLTKLYELSQIALFVYLVFLISIVSNFKYTVFYATSIVFLSLIVLNYYKSFITTRNSNTFRVMVAFLMILVGNIFFAFVFAVPAFYAVGEILTLVGFLQLLYTYQRIR